ncbi:hypothetical protein IEO21_09609 [Rhodonia placenta]|uniref:HNH nuclease domain-containing protein n=1 Tax=Rhodonia placenta TaxID=104341 RepID=A0A8H7NU51_9APHY|nr:hypothetical protein IEO21_09609 [Postia placenta]
MVNGFKPRRSNRLKHLPKVDYCENKTADGKRKRGALDDEDEYTPSREGTPENQKTSTHAPENQRSPSRRVRRKTAITKDARQRAVDASQNEGACIISGMKDKSVQQCHVLPRATKSDMLTALEWWWDIEELSVDSRHNQVFLRADLHALWDRGYIAIMPMPDVMKEYLAKWQDGGRHKVLEASDEAKIHEYCVISHPDLDNYAIREGFTYGFEKVGTIRSHAKPHFMALNAAMKLKENKEMWVKALEVFYERIHLQVDASSFVEELLTLSDVWIAPPPGEAQLIMKEEKEQAAEEASSLLATAPTGEPMSPKRPKALMGPGGLEMEERSKSKAHRAEGEPCGSNLKLFAAYLAPTGSRCLLSLQEDKSVQGCHVVPRRTDDDTCAQLAAWWGLDKFDVDSPFNIFLLRADIHCLWDQGLLMFVPEPHIIDEFLEQDIVPINGGLSLDEPSEVSDFPVYRYGVVAHCDLPVTKKNAAFPRNVKTVGYVESRVPPHFVIYNVGLALSKGERDGFVKALDAFYKQHKVDYEAIRAFSGIERLVRRWLVDETSPKIVPSYD